MVQVSKGGREFGFDCKLTKDEPSRHNRTSLISFWCKVQGEKGISGEGTVRGDLHVHKYR